MGRQKVFSADSVQKCCRPGGGHANRHSLASLGKQVRPVPSPSTLKLSPNRTTKNFYLFPEICLKTQSKIVEPSSLSTTQSPTNSTYSRLTIQDGLARVKYVKERIGEEVTDWSQLLQRRQRREERRRLQELERQKEIQRRREAGEIPEVPTGATTAANPKAPSGTATSIPPFTRRVTRAATRAASNSVISNTTTVTTTTTETPTVMAPVSAPASATADVAALVSPTVIATTVEHEEHGYMDLVDPALFEFGNDDDVADPPANDAVSSVQASMPTTSKNAAPPSFTPATTPAAVSAYAIDVEEHLDMDRSRPRNVGTVHQQAMMPRTAQGNQEVVQPTTDARTKAALQLVPVVDISKLLIPSHVQAA